MSENPVKDAARQAVEPVVGAASAVKETVDEAAADSREHDRIRNGVEATMQQRADEHDPCHG